MALLRVCSLGEIVCEPAFVTSFNGKPVLYPNNYVVERPVFSVSGEDTDNHRDPFPNVQLAFHDDEARRTSGPFFVASIHRGPTNTPVFTVTRSDCPEQKRYVSDKSPTTVWREALEGALHDFEDREAELGLRKNSRGYVVVNGLRQYGLYFSDVVAQLMTLPGAEMAIASFMPAELTVADSSQRSATASAAVAANFPTGRRSVGSITPTAKKHSVATVNNNANACPDCGLVSAPFCAVSGKPHALPPCPECGLTSAFCPLTGKPHGGSRLNRQKGEVVLPKAPRSKRASNKKVAEVNDSGDTVEAKEEAGQKRSKTATRTPLKRVRKVDPVDTTAGLSNGTAVPAAKRRRRSRKVAETDRDASESTGKPSVGGARQMTLDEVGDNVPISHLLPPAPYVYPPLRPPLSKSDKLKAANALHAMWRTQEAQNVMPPWANALHLQFVSTPQQRVAGVGRRRQRTRDSPAMCNAEDEGSSDPAVALLKTEEGCARSSVAPTCVHPLGIRELSTSVTGKRFTKFLLQYTSERAKVDALRKCGTAVAAGRTASSTNGKKGSADAAETDANNGVDVNSFSAATGVSIADTAAVIDAPVTAGTGEVDTEQQKAEGESAGMVK